MLGLKVAAPHPCQLPEDPAALKRLIKEKDDYIKLLTKEKEARMKDKDTIIRMQAEKLASVNAELLWVTGTPSEAMMDFVAPFSSHGAWCAWPPCAGRLTCRYLIEKMEYVLSEKRRRNVKAQRAHVWEDIFDKNFQLLDDMRQIYGGDVSEAAAAEVVVKIFARCSTETHNPGVEVLPIRLGLLTVKEAKFMVKLCRKYPILYQVYDGDGRAVDNTLYE